MREVQSRSLMLKWTEQINRLDQPLSVASQLFQPYYTITKMEYMESGQQVYPNNQGSSSTARSAAGSSKKRATGARPSSPILRGGGVKEESPEPELDEVSFLVLLSLTAFMIAVLGPKLIA